MIEHVIGHVDGIRGVEELRARWLGHRLAVELDIAVDSAASLTEADDIANALEKELAGHVPALARTVIRVRPHRARAASEARPVAARHSDGRHSHEKAHSHSHAHDHGHDAP